MNLKIVFGVLAVFCIVHEISATFKLCNCVGEGKDVCSCKKGIKAPRPYPLEKPEFKHVKKICKELEAPPQFKPIGDVCSCGSTIVKPAPFGVKKCSCTKPKWEHKQNTDCGCSSCKKAERVSAEESSGQPCGEVKRAPMEFTFEFERNPRPVSAPQARPANTGSADVVSVAIARRLANSIQNSISERDLQYGSHKEPKPNRRDEKRVIANNEDQLHETRGQVIELKKSMFVRRQSSESDESSEEQQRRRRPVGFIPERLRYDEIGYGTYQPHSPRYVTVQNREAEHSVVKSKKEQKSHGKKKSCGCRKDLLVQASSQSEQSATFENYSGDQFLEQPTLFSS